MHVIPNAGHPAYLDDPTLWNTMLYNFMRLDCVRCGGGGGGGGDEEEAKARKRSISESQMPPGWGDADFGPDL